MLKIYMNKDGMDKIGRFGVLLSIWESLMRPHPKDTDFGETTRVYFNRWPVKPDTCQSTNKVFVLARLLGLMLMGVEGSDVRE